MSTIKNKSTVVDHAKQLIAGTSKHLGNVAQVKFTGGSYTPAEITSKLELIVSLREGVDAAKATTKARLAAEKADMPALHTFIGALVTFVKATYGDMPEVLTDFGIHPKTRAPPTVHTKAAATAKRAATRVARNTMGPKKKAGIKGDVTGVNIVPVTTTQPTVSTPNSPNTGATSTGATASPTTGPTASPSGASPTAGRTAGSTPNAT